MREMASRTRSQARRRYDYGFLRDLECRGISLSRRDGGASYGRAWQPARTVGHGPRDVRSQFGREARDPEDSLRTWIHISGYTNDGLPPGSRREARGLSPPRSAIDRTAIYLSRTLSSGVGLRR